MRYLILLCLLVSLVNCSSNFSVRPTPPALLMHQVHDYLAHGKVDKSIGILKQLSGNYLFNDTTIKAQILLMWLYYSKGKASDLETISGEFLKYYPYNKDTPWVEYMYALSLYQQMPNSKKDISLVYRTLDLFNSYINKYPNTKYAKDLQFKKTLVINILAQRDIQIGNYYLTHKAYMAAVQRFKEVLHTYNNTIFVPEALYKLTFIMLNMGINYEAMQYYQLLQSHYGNTIWSEQAKKLLEINKTIAPTN